MPYIKKENRKSLNKHIYHLLEILQQLPEEDMAGHLNYCFSKLVFDLFDARPSYGRANALNGVFVSAQQEFSRRKIVPYEIQKIYDNGDI